jgi:ubiquinone/menaquinone biosynthesis C-methylase UbiE
MKSKIELYSGIYKNYTENIYREIRKETYGEDIGQNSWITSDEYRQFFSRLKLSDDKNVLEIATGSGGPAVFMTKETGCLLTGIELNENGVNNARKLADENGLSDKMKFVQGDASEPLPFSDNSFDVVICIDSINHLKERDKVLQEIRRALKTGGTLLYTDPIVVTGILTNEEIAIRSSIGFFLFVPVGENERLLKDAGFQQIYAKDITENIASVSMKWFNAREKRKEHLLQIEEEKNFDGLQSFLWLYINFHHKGVYPGLCMLP